jgi:DNA repair exonuclease SbcCD ATPase subunit
VKYIGLIAEYLPPVLGFTFLINQQLIAGFISLAFYIPINQFNRRREQQNVDQNNTSVNTQIGQQTKILSSISNQQSVVITQLPGQIEDLETRIGQYENEITQIGQQVKPLSQLVNQNTVIITQLSGQVDDLEQRVEQGNQKITQIGQQVHPLSRLVNLHRVEIRQTNRQVDSLSQGVDQCLSNIESVQDKIDISLDEWINEIRGLLQTAKSDYTVLSNRQESFEVLKDALKQAKKRLILVCPWINWNVIYSKGIFADFRDKLTANKDLKIYVFYGYQGDVHDLKQDAINVTLSRHATCQGNKWKYDAIEKLTKLEEDWPDRFILTIRGTHEKFLVCDEEFAMLGSHNFLTSLPNPTEKELGIRTTDQNIIKSLIGKFDSI